MKDIQELLDTSRRAGAAIAIEDLSESFPLGALPRVRLTGEMLALRLVELSQNVLTARALARSYLSIARSFLEAARRAGVVMQPENSASHLREANLAHEQARKCLSFARLCERRADGLVCVERGN